MDSQVSVAELFFKVRMDVMSEAWTNAATSLFKGVDKTALLLKRAEWGGLSYGATARCRS